MAMRTARLCPGCGHAVTGPCPTCSKRRDTRRGTAQSRGFTSRWGRFSKLWLSRHPLCGERADGELHREHSRCGQAGQLTPAECTDHIDGHARADDRETFYDETRLQSLCLTCNRLKAIDWEGGFGR